ncbi:extensin [Croceibacterium mercuriale]|uniref:Extensin n=1 Tax=Croceibacterium mercuriale TaxID=1572751 RepID=A0A0B2BWE6_9SPHN|nr:extensin family protein [Croceibacterium mercuriale]KHL25953.1 extensin [Croceibacterium mercuriale]
MTMRFSRQLDQFGKDRMVLGLLLLAGLLLAARAWLADHPQHDPWAPLDLNDPPGWATQRKLASLRSDPDECRAVLERSGVAFAVLEPAGEGTCRRADRTQLRDAPFSPARPVTTCPVAAAVQVWLTQAVQPAAAELLGSPIVRIEHLGTFSCRRIGGGGNWSEHATGNAIDIAAFVTDDGQRVSVLRDWEREGTDAEFLRNVRDGACDVFGTVLSPDYNAAHADHLHLDQAARGLGGFCR